MTSIRATPAQLGTSQALFDKVALSDLQDTVPKYVLNLGGTFKWDQLSVSVHELIYGESSQFENDGGATNGEIMFYETTIGVTPITNLEVSLEAMAGLTDAGAPSTCSTRCPTSATIPTAPCSSARATTERFRNIRRSRRSASTAAITTAKSLTSSEVEGGG